MTGWSTRNADGSYTHHSVQELYNVADALGDHFEGTHSVTQWSAITAFVLGLGSILFFWTVLAPLGAIIFGIVAFASFNPARNSRVNTVFAAVGLGLGVLFMIPVYLIFSSLFGG